MWSRVSAGKSVLSYEMKLFEQTSYNHKDLKIKIKKNLRFSKITSFICIQNVIKYVLKKKVYFLGNYKKAKDTFVCY